MSNRTASFRQSDLSRVLRALRAAGFGSAKVEVDPTTGKIGIVTSGNRSGEVQKTDLDAWMAKHAREA